LYRGLSGPSSGCGSRLILLAVLLRWLLAERTERVGGEEVAKQEFIIR
jgi:hypothetical protein